jgi:hypothetical protein
VWAVDMVPRNLRVRILGEERGEILQIHESGSLEFAKEKERPSDHTDCGSST